MLGGNISNRSAPIIAVDAELLFSDDAKSLLDVVLRKKKGVKPNRINIHAINNIWNHADIAIYIIFNPVMRNGEELEQFLYDNFVNYTRIFPYDNPLTLKHFCEYQFMYLTSNSDELLSQVGAGNTRRLQDLLVELHLARR